MSSWTAESGLPVAKSLSNPRMSFCNPRIRGRFSRGPVVRVSEDAGRPNEAWRRTRRGRAVGRTDIYVLAFEKTRKDFWDGDDIGKVS